VDRISSSQEQTARRVEEVEQTVESIKQQVAQNQEQMANIDRKLNQLLDIDRKLDQLLDYQRTSVDGPREGSRANPEYARGTGALTASRTSTGVGCGHGITAYTDTVEEQVLAAYRTAIN